MPDSISVDELKQMPIWVIWNYDVRDGKPTKIPKSAKGTATGTNEKYRHTWVTYSEAVAAQNKYHASGVGFVIPKGIAFIDIDHSTPETPFAKGIIDNIDSYTEYSVSGSGVHIYCRCEYSELPISHTDKGDKICSDYYQNNHKKGLEIYIGGLTNKFAVYTGNIMQSVKALYTKPLPH